MSHPSEGSPEIRSTPNSYVAALVAALAIGASVASEAEAQSSSAYRPSGIEAIEATPIVKYKQVLLEKLANNELPNKVLNISVAFSMNPDKPAFYYAPENINQPTLSLYRHNGVKRKYWLGRYPRYIHAYGEDWLAFVDIDTRREDYLYNPYFGPAKDAPNTLFLKAGNMPADTRIFSNPENGISPGKRVLPARVDKRENIVVKGLPITAPELMLGFAQKKEVNDIIASLGLVPSRIRSLENLK